MRFEFNNTPSRGQPALSTLCVDSPTGSTSFPLGNFVTYHQENKFSNIQTTKDRGEMVDIFGFIKSTT